MQLQDKVVVITGAARGLGRAYAEAMAAEGASVYACDVNSCDETVAAITAAGGSAASGSVDISSMESCQAMADGAVAAFGRIDVLVNNAALYGGLKGGRFESLDEDQWDAVMNVNIKGVWQTCKACVNPLRKAGGGSIINIASLAAVFGMPYGLDYVASKAAVIGMTRGMARELGGDSIRVNAVAPSAVMTESTSEFFGEKMDKAKVVIAKGQVLQRNLETHDLTGTIIYLASDNSAFVTGQTHMVDGGSWFL
ncbi:SDR family oxidoreductase [Halieaceae bacterium IMCC14734]|uniref:SDR family oxidoreductase n=1 Tax=Candidatus Litorirhabdus singularis TaxID=2518993 RepID=A0ABT3TFK5_9GAMM|nr:SDR family oxidoreductase [Candidatus Litorirhabdus singularis]MCX2980192.1 SDR family oxidoreductase [Candidatus Litorirhabdus singularis]